VSKQSATIITLDRVTTCKPGEANSADHSIVTQLKSSAQASSIADACRNSDSGITPGTETCFPDNIATLAQVSQGAVKSPGLMNAFELDSYLRDRATHHAREIAKDIVYLREMRELLSAQGRRTDLKKPNRRLIGKDGRKWDLGWQAWAKSYGLHINKSLSTIKRALAEGVEPEPPTLTDGSIVMLPGQSEPLFVLDVHETSKEVDIIPLDAKTDKAAKTVDASSIKKVTIHNAAIGTFYIRDKETGSEYVYADHGKLSLVTYPPVLEAKWEEEQKERTERLKEDQRRKKNKKKRGQAESANRYLSKIAKAEKRNATRSKKKDIAKSVEAVGLVKAARLEGDDGFALFEKAAFAPFSLDKATSGKYAAQAECEAARDSVNSKRAKYAPEPVSPAQKKTPKRVQLAQANSLSA
jgi:hypothetical protein